MLNEQPPTNQTIIPAPAVHIFALGQQRKIALSELGDIGNLSPAAAILQAVALFLNLPPHSLDQFVVSRDEETGNLVIRPPAVFGGS